jgi:hypothetical protein
MRILVPNSLFIEALEERGALAAAQSGLAPAQGESAILVGGSGKLLQGGVNLRAARGGRRSRDPSNAGYCALHAGLRPGYPLAMVARSPWFSLAAGGWIRGVRWRDTEGSIHSIDGPDGRFLSECGTDASLERPR